MSPARRSSLTSMLVVFAGVKFFFCMQNCQRSGMHFSTHALRPYVCVLSLVCRSEFAPAVDRNFFSMIKEQALAQIFAF